MKRSVAQALPGQKKSYPRTPPVAKDDAFAQSLCLECGLCCNGTLFSYVPLTEGDLSPSPADHIVLDNGQAGLKQKCRFYRKNLCAIYQTGRPHSCITFECNLLKRYTHGEVSRERALETIQQTVHQVERVKAQLNLPAKIKPRNLTESFKAWLDLRGGCYSNWSAEHEIILQSYHALLAHLQKTFGLAQGAEEHASNAEPRSKSRL